MLPYTPLPTEIPIIMKKGTVLLLFSFLVFCSAFAQSRHVMLLPSFEQGTVFLKHSLPVRVPLNYDAGMATMRYMDGNQIMELLNIEDIDSIHIGTHHFVPIRGKFCEVFRHTPTVRAFSS